MNKPTSDEIMRALEYCTKDEKDENISCKERGCPFYKRCKKDINALGKAAFNLIKHKDAEIERLKEGIKFERERVDNIPNLIKQAIKEFGEELKKYKAYVSGWDIYVVREHHIEKLIKEKVGDK